MQLSDKMLKRFHVQSIDAFIPQALQYARKETVKRGREYVWKPGKDKVPYKFYYETHFFHQEMNRLTVDAGIRVPFR